MNFSTEELLQGILAQDKRILGKAITLIESKKPEHRVLAEELLKKILPYAGKSVRIGITGVPGAGKSTFIESFGKFAISQGKYRDWETDRKSTRLNSSHITRSRMPSSA